MKSILFIACGLVFLGGSPTWGVTLEWTRQLGTSASDQGSGVSADGLGNVYISGYTAGSLSGTNAVEGEYDAFISKYNATGALQWTRQLGTSARDLGLAVSPDGLGNVYLSGSTFGNLGGTNAGSNDAFVSKYDAAGILQWTRQFGTTSLDVSSAVSADELGNVYISGYTYGSLGGTNAGDSDAFVSKYDGAGNMQWTRQLGPSASEGGQVCADGLGNVYLAVGTVGGGFVNKYDAAGNLQWTLQTVGGKVSADGPGNLYLSGTTFGSLGGTYAGDGDAYVAKYDGVGDLQWTRQLGTSAREEGRGVSADGLGNVYLSGYTLGSLVGTNAGSRDAFVAKYDATGNLQWTRQLGTSAREESSGASADGLGNVYISGYSEGSLGGTNAGGEDAFVAKFSDPIPGDYNGNGIVDASDYVVWRNGLGTTYTQADYDIWRAHFGQTAGSGAAFQPVESLSTNVPEPSTLLLAALALVSLSWRQRRR